jgi:hypothetical protein
MPPPYGHEQNNLTQGRAVRLADSAFGGEALQLRPWMFPVS